MVDDDLVNIAVPWSRLLFRGGLDDLVLVLRAC